MNSIENQVIDIVSAVLTSRGRPNVQLTKDSGMGNPTEWDSLAFVAIFLAVNEKFVIDASDDDAIHFMSVGDIASFVRERT